MKNERFAIVALLAVVVLLAMPATVLGEDESGQLSRATLSFDFDSGVDPDLFSLFNIGGLFVIGTEGPNVRIAKTADDGTVLPDEFLRAGIESIFSIDGDFNVTVDFALHDFPPTSERNQLNESVLDVTSIEGGSFQVLRFRLGELNLIEAYADGVGSIGVQQSSINSGRYRITRTGATLAAFFAETDGSFISLGTVELFSGPARVSVLAAQGMNSGRRATTALDVSFDNLVIEADRIRFACQADIDESGVVDFADLLLVLAQWGPCPPECLADINGDGNVDFEDILPILIEWGSCDD